jgi:hypothetical protein
MRALADVQKYREKALAVRVVDEARGAVVPPLEHMQYVTREHCTQWTRHAVTMHYDALGCVIEPPHVRPTSKESDPMP